MSAKKFAVRSLALILSILTLFMFVSCNTGTNDIGTESDGSEHPTETESETESGSLPEENTTGGSIDEPKDEPKVNYIVKETTVKTEGYDLSKKGSIMSEDETGVKSLFFADYEDGDKTVGGEASFRDANVAAVKDGMLYFPHDGQDFLGNWSTWSPVVGASVKDYIQVQFSADMKSFRPNSSETNSWTSTFIGCYVSDYANKIPDTPGDGLWFTFTPENEITILGGNDNGWPAGFAKVQIEQGFGEMRHIDIVCTEDHDTYIYASYDGKESVLLLKTSMSETEISVYDGSGELVISVPNDPSNCAGDHFTVFAHNGGACVMDNVKILVGEKESEKVEKEITAVPEPGATLGLDITDKKDLVSICYSVWFDGILGTGTEPVTDFNNVTEVLEGKREWGGETAFHYWAKPAQGYYRSTDKNAIRNNMKLLGDADVDFIILDYTNANDGYITNSATGEVWAFAPLRALCETIMEMRAEGQKTPYIVLWCGKSEGPLIQAFYDKFYTEEKWEDCFVYWEGKPFMLYTVSEAEFPAKDLFTVRRMWGLTTDRCWRFLNIDNEDTAYKREGAYEQISVAVASQETYMSMPTAHGRNHGIFFYEQWTEAFEVRPKVVTLTWWNEWAAQRFIVDGQTAFVDNYNQEYSRDIEPMEGGHGDQYYQWMKQYIEAYKAGKDCPRLVEEGY